MKYFLGIDIGTTNIKLAVFNKSWESVLISEKEISTLTPKEGYSEQNAEEIYETVTGQLKEVLISAEKQKIKIAGIGLSTAMHSFLPVDSDLKPLSNMIIWSDIRAIQISEALKKNSTVNKYLEKNNVPMHPMLPLAKWLWFNQYSGQKKAIFKVLSFKDYLIARWFGELIVDESMAASMGYYNLAKNDWNYALLQYLKLDIKQLPEIKPTTHVLEKWNEELLTYTGLNKLPQLVLGSSDGCLANLSAGVIDKTKASLTIGTSGAVRTAYEKPSSTGQRLFCYPVLKDYYVVGGAVNNGGNALEWFKNNLSSSSSENFWDEFEQSVRSIKPGADGMIFLPYLHGERAPLWDPSLRGAYLGISNSHKNIHFLRATLEGIAYALKHIFKLIDARPNTIKTVIADGGFTKSKVWVQLISDVLGIEVFCPDQSFGAAKGAAMLCKLAIENLVLEELVANQEISGELFKPKASNKDAYESLFLHYLNASSVFNQLQK